MNAIVYECTYENRSWECILSHIIKGKEVVGFTVTGRESRYQSIWSSLMANSG